MAWVRKNAVREAKCRIDRTWDTGCGMRWDEVRTILKEVRETSSEVTFQFPHFRLSLVWVSTLALSLDPLQQRERSSESRTANSAPLTRREGLSVRWSLCLSLTVRATLWLGRAGRHEGWKITPKLFLSCSRIRKESLPPLSVSTLRQVTKVRSSSRSAWRCRIRLDRILSYFSCGTARHGTVNLWGKMLSKTSVYLSLHIYVFVSMPYSLLVTPHHFVSILLSARWWWWIKLTSPARRCYLLRATVPSLCWTDRPPWTDPESWN